MLAYLNGQYTARSSATISVDDRGFVFGDGVYEVWRVINGQLFERERHLSRLAYGLQELRIAPPEIARASVLDEVAGHLLRESNLTDGEATLYLEITRGVAPRAHAFPPAGTAPTVYATVNRFLPPEDLRARGAAAITMRDVRWLRCDIKTVQLLPNVMAKQAATERGATDALMIRDGALTESSHANVMGVIDGVIRTHPANNLILSGITRAVILDLARDAGLRVAEQAITERDLPQLEELFLAGTTTDVMPIVRLDDRPVGPGVPGPITMNLFGKLRAYMNSSCSVRADSRTVPTPA
ncbi:MAG TPA: aminotransferase class IV [Gemmatimonadaceae bacterium]|nr:aminotransferase class IV [Gemmatimonadaceae bacterium]